MRDDPRVQAEPSVSSSMVSRRLMLTSAAKLAGGAALAGAIGAKLAQLAVAQDEIILTASASEVGARPGAGYAQGAAALAAADSASGFTAQGASGGSGSGAGPGDSSGGPGDQSRSGGAGSGGCSGGGPGDSSGAGPGSGGSGDGAGTGGGGGAGTGGGDQSPGY